MSTNLERSEKFASWTTYQDGGRFSPVYLVYILESSVYAACQILILK